MYNTIDIFSAKMELSGQYEVSEALAGLGSMLRYNNSGKSMFATVAMELEYLRCYMSLQHLKFGDRIDLQVRAPNDLLEIRIPKFLLQPVVENSIKHGLPPAGTLQIVIDAQIMDDQRFFRTADVPLEQEDRTESIGLGNINARLKLFYGENSQIEIESIPGFLTRTILTLPCPA
jgi:sensor histidine kinase YesM